LRPACGEREEHEPGREEKKLEIENEATPTREKGFAQGFRDSGGNAALDAGVEEKPQHGKQGKNGKQH